MRIIRMRIISCLLTGLTLASPGPRLLSQTAAPDQVPEVNRHYQLLREDEDWSFLKDPKLREDFWDPIKYIPLRRSADDWYMTIGGEAREVWEQIGNDNWGQSPHWNG